MQFLFISEKGRALPIAWRMQEEGADVFAYVHDPHYRRLYDGLLKEKLSSAEELGKYLEQMDPIVPIIFDGHHTLEPAKGDAALIEADEAVLNLRKVTSPSSPRLFGSWSAELIKEGKKVVGCSARSEKTMLNRKTGKKVASQVGLTIPRFQACPTRANILGFLSSNKRSRWVMRPIEPCDCDASWVEGRPGELIEKLTSPWGDQIPKDLPVTLEEYVCGFDYHEEVWWDGERFCCLNATIDERNFGADGTGPVEESALTFTWMKRKASVPWENMRSWLAFPTSYSGPISARFRVDHEGKLFFTDWNFGLRYDSIFGLLTLLRSTICRLFWESFQAGFMDNCGAATVRASVPPYPRGSRELCSKLAKGVPVRADLKDFWGVDVWGGVRRLEVAGTDGFVGVGSGIEIVCDGPVIPFERAVRSVTGAVTGDLQFRSDTAGISESWDLVKRHRLGSYA